MVSKVGIAFALAVAAIVSSLKNSSLFLLIVSLFFSQFVASTNANPQPQQKIIALERERRDAALDLNQIISTLINTVLNELLLPVRNVLLNLLESVKSLLNQLVIPDSTNLLGLILNPILTSLTGTLTSIQTVINNGTPYTTSSK